VTKDAHEICVVLKALELRAVHQEATLGGSSLRADEAIKSAREEKGKWQELAQSIGFGKDAYTSLNTNAQQPKIGQPDSSESNDTQSWGDTINEARAQLRQEGIDPDEIKLKETGELTKLDVAASVVIGVLSAWIPSIEFGQHGSLVDQFAKIQTLADNNQLPGVIQSIFGDGKPAAFMDAKGWEGGTYHRFVHGHDLLTALPGGVKQLGLVQGIIQVFQHLLRDSFGKTGIPLPGSTTIGDSIASTLGHEGGITDIIRPRDLSRYTGVRMTDVAATGSTSLMLWGYRKFRKYDAGGIQDCKLAIISHGVCFLAVASMAQMGIMPPQSLSGRSFLNHVSLLAMMKNVVQLWRINRDMTKRIAKMNVEIEKSIAELQSSRKDAFRDDIDHDLRLMAKHYA
jgi:hypothetical protein